MMVIQIVVGTCGMFPKDLTWKSMEKETIQTTALLDWLECSEESWKELCHSNSCERPTNAGMRNAQISDNHLLAQLNRSKYS